MSRHTASDMRWHKEKRVDDGVLRHPNVPSFSSESRNVRLGLSSDGFNPFEPFLMMSLLIPGPHSPGKEIDVYLRPLIDELKELWHDGIETYDVSIGQYFKMHAAILWTINDFPAYGMLSGWSTKGYMACPLERIFPPLFDVMVHLLVHLPHEAKLLDCLPRRFNSEAYIVNESLTFCSQYLLGIETKFNRPDRNVDDLNDHQMGFCFSQRARPFGMCTTSEHMEQLEKETNDNLFQRQKQLFPKWFANHMKILRHQGSPEATDELYSLASGPDRRVSLYHSCVVNGIRFHTKDRDDRHTTQNSGVLVLGDHYEDMIDFYGVLLNVVVLDYIFNNQVVLFKLQDDGVLRCINVDNKWYEEDPYVLASQAQQIFYVNDPKLGSSWKVQTTTNDSENDNEDPTIEEAYQENDSSDIVWSRNQDCNVLQYQRADGDPSYIDIENVVDHGRRFENDDLIAFINDQDEEDETLVDYCSEDNENSDEEDHDSDSDSDS
ncbi:hypothetical protein AAG906_028980 [Vitis piasezkii]